MSRRDNIFDSLAIIPDHGIKTMADKGVRVMVDTNELSAEEMAKLFALKGQAGRFVFAPAEAEEIEVEVPEIPKEFKDDKSPSQRLRSVMFIVWKQGSQTMDFNQWYSTKMEATINKYKEQIDD